MDDNKRKIEGEVKVDVSGTFVIVMLLLSAVLQLGTCNERHKIDESVSGDAECSKETVGRQVVTRDRTLLECVELKGTLGTRHAFVRVSRVEIP